MAESVYKRLAEVIVRDYNATPDLPGERLLADRYACTRTTIRAALKELSSHGLLEQKPRCRPRLVQKPQSEEVPVLPQQFTIVMFVDTVKMQDSHFLDFVGGVIHAARTASLNLFIREIDDTRDLAGISTTEQLHIGIKADGYILTSRSVRLGNLLENHLKPCVVLGVLNDKDLVERRRFIQVCQPLREKVEFLVKRMAAFGHKKLLIVRWDVDELPLLPNPSHGCEVDFLSIRLNPDSNIPRPGVGQQVVDAIGDRTGIILMFGAACALEIYNFVLGAGYEIPRRLSFALNCGRFDFFTRVYNLDSIYASGADEGANCIEELVTQLKNGILDFSIKSSVYTYREGKSIAPPMSNREIEIFDQQYIHIAH